MLRVHVVADWEKRSRPVSFWKDDIEGRFADRKRFSLDIQVYRPNVADGTWYRDGDEECTPRHLFLRDGHHVTIINWDAINGDPTYGAAFSRDWFEYNQTGVLDWVRRGGILIIEGQATGHVPEQRSYDALVGRGQLRVCGLEDPDDLSAQVKRMGDKGQLTRAAERSGLFKEIQDVTTEVRAGVETMFPGRAGAIAPPGWAETRWGLYRGWFRSLSPARGRFGWVPLVKTADRKGRSHAILVGARVGDGAIFASTMFLGRTGQVVLLEALIGTRGRTEKLPTPRREIWRGGIVNWVRLLVAAAFLAVVYATVAVTTSAAPFVAAAATLAASVAVVGASWLIARVKQAARSVTGK